MEPTTRGSATAKERRALIPTVAKRKFRIKGFVLQERCHSNLLILLEAAIALFVSKSTKYIQ